MGSTLTRDQQADVDRAREFIAASDAWHEVLATFLGLPEDAPPDLLNAAGRGYATETVRTLLVVIGELTGGAS